MFEIGWSELMVIGIVALIVIGPRDLPEVFRQLGRFTAKLRGMARDFSRAMEDAAKESGVSDVTNAAKDLRSATSPVSTSLRSAVDRFEKWDPVKGMSVTPPAGQTAVPSPAQTPAAAAATPGGVSVRENAAMSSAVAQPSPATQAVEVAAATETTGQTPIASAALGLGSASAAAPVANASPEAAAPAAETAAAPKRSPGRVRKTETPQA